jgi:hypothetical protein
MQEQGKSAGEDRPRSGEGESRPQRAGEAATTRFGMEEGDNSDVPATGDGTREEDPAAERSR